MCEAGRVRVVDSSPSLLPARAIAAFTSPTRHCACMHSNPAASALRLNYPHMPFRGLAASHPGTQS